MGRSEPRSKGLSWSTHKLQIIEVKQFISQWHHFLNECNSLKAITTNFTLYLYHDCVDTFDIITLHSGKKLVCFSFEHELDIRYLNFHMNCIVIKKYLPGEAIEKIAAPCLSILLFT